jgi:hypothetical protein
MKGFFHYHHGKDGKYKQRDYFLDHFQLEKIDAGGVPNSIGRNCQAIFDQSDEPANDDSLPQWPSILLEMVVPGKGHKDVGSEE